MLVVSKFRTLFWIRIGTGFFLFLLILSFCINGLKNPDAITMQFLILASVVLLFLIYISIDLFKVFSLKITETGIEKTSLLLRKKQYIPFNSILSVNRQKTRQKNSRAINITDGYHFSVLKFKNGNSLIISPDNFKNYAEIIASIKIGIE